MKYREALSVSKKCPGCCSNTLERFMRQSSRLNDSAKPVEEEHKAEPELDKTQVKQNKPKR